MSQGQPRRPQTDQNQAIKYGDVFDVTGGLASKPIAPRDAATMLADETQVLGKPMNAGVAPVMQSAATVNVSSGAVGPDQGNEMVDREAVSVSKSRDAQGKVVVTEAIADHMVGKYNLSDVKGTTHSPSPVPATGDVRWTTPSPTPYPTPTPTIGDVQWTTPTPVAAVDNSGMITIGEALEATAISVGDKPVDRGDAAAIQVAEARANSGNNINQRGGLGTTAQAAATFNTRVAYDYNKITISDVLSDASTKLPNDKAVTSEDADGVRGAELSNRPDSMATPGGVADTMNTAARVNRNDTP